MKAHEVVMEWVTRELSNGRLLIGDHLPCELTLAETLEVRNTRVALLQAGALKAALTWPACSSVQYGVNAGTRFDFAIKESLPKTEREVRLLNRRGR